ncbi:MAG TPA: class I SAM-dependent methyltransferase [Terriglobales bacterium]|nr:class I SAM-dependent methyltransferase [Terriglobales bacterium]
MTLAPVISSETLNTLKRHPGVRDVAVARSEAAPILFVVPEDCYLDRVLGRHDAEQRRLQAWRKTYDLMQLGKDAKSAAAGFNIAGWRSSYTRQAIPDHEMREWVDASVGNILSLAPRDVLEVGCGSGLLLFPVAPRCRRYVGIDFSSVSLQRIREQMQSRSGDWSGVELLEQSAEDLTGFPEQSFDTVIINSVAQYFPSLRYCTRVLKNVIRLIKPGGHLFIGDCRSLPLLPMYAASLEVHDSKPEDEESEFAHRVQRRMEREEELVLSQAYFLSLANQVEGASVEVRPKRGTINNELTRYRFDVFFSVSGPADAQPVEWHEWYADKWTFAKLREQLLSEESHVLALSGIPNSRLHIDLEILATKGVIAQFDNSRSQPEQGELDPQAIWNLAAEARYNARLSWNSSRRDGSFDAVFIPEKMASHPIKWPVPSAKDTVHFANWPGQAGILKRLGEELGGLLSKESPRIVFVDSIPTYEDGTADEEALLASVYQTGFRNR